MLCNLQAITFAFNTLVNRNTGLTPDGRTFLEVMEHFIFGGGGLLGFWRGAFGLVRRSRRRKVVNGTLVSLSPVRKSSLGLWLKWPPGGFEVGGFEVDTIKCGVVPIVV